METVTQYWLLLEVTRHSVRGVATAIISRRLLLKFCMTKLSIPDKPAAVVAAAAALANSIIFVSLVMYHMRYQ